MTQPAAAPTTPTAPSAPSAATSSGLRTLHLVRVAFSLLWVALVLATSASLTSADEPTAVAAALLVAYPLWDAAATLAERRIAGTGSTHRVTAANIGLGLAAAAGMAAAAFSTVGTALAVFGAWAALSGAAQLLVALRRRRSVGAQWPMALSGGQSVLAGATIAATSASASSDLSTVAGYSAFGALWFLASAVALSAGGRRGKR